MVKQRTQWKKQGRSTPTVDYDDSTTDYDGATTPYAGNGETPASVIKRRALWSKAIKPLTHFVINTAAHTNEEIYNTNRVYNVDATYNGIVVGEPHSTAKKPMIWSKA
jgi:hypothetical protein